MISDGTMHFVKLAAGALVVMLVINAYNDWSDDRATAAARAAMTPAQRSASDDARQRQAAAAAKAVQREAKQKLFRAACMRALLNAMYDPDAAQLTWSAGSINADGTFDGFIEGRAKNAFGALIIGAWHCQASEHNGDVTVFSMNQYKP